MLVGLFILGYALLYVGVIVTGPIAALFFVYSYRSLRQDHIAHVAIHRGIE